jgi:protein-tyrosine-phosphatase
MKRLLVSMDEERYEDLRRLAFEKKASMADLVRYAIEKVYEDQLDAMAGQRGLEEYLKDPSQAVSIEELMEELGIELPRRRATKSRARDQKAAS